MNTAANLERIAEELACDNFSEGVRYFEVLRSTDWLIDSLSGLLA